MSRWRRRPAASNKYLVCGQVNFAFVEHAQVPAAIQVRREMRVSNKCERKLVSAEHEIAHADCWFLKARIFALGIRTLMRSPAE